MTQIPFIRRIVEEMSIFGSLTSAGIIFVLMLVLGFNEHAIQVLVGVLLVMALCYVTKAIWKTARPHVESDNVGGVLVMLDNGSFPSVHMARATVQCLVLLLFWPMLSVIGKILLLFFLACVMAFVGFSRVALRRHFIRDVVGGLIYGLIVMIIIWSPGTAEILSTAAQLLSN